MHLSTTGTPLLAVRSASFGYADRIVVSRVDLTVSAGEVVALLGPNGSGKSTLVRGLLGLTDQVAGDVELFGTPRQRFREHTRLGYVPQRHSLSASVRATVTEVVEVGRLPHRRWWRPASRTDRAVVREAIDAVGLGDRAGEEVASLSGGQQRRALVARALAARPDMLLMDEPTAGVDRASQVALSSVMSTMAAAGTGILVVTHELSALHDIVTRVIALDHGQVVFDGPPGDHHRTDHDRGNHHDDDPADPAWSQAPLDTGTPRSAP
ncbi:MAG: metal ABC transporter ATP-binding protein [Dermatophilaceae bacterium]